LNIPPETPPGEYRATVTAKAGSVGTSLPLVLEVSPLTLPEERHRFVTEWFSTSEFRKHHQVNPNDEAHFYRLLKVYAQNMAEHRQNAYRVGLESIECRRAPDGKLQFDFSRF